jgi:hypothetical protein
MATPVSLQHQLAGTEDEVLPGGGGVEGALEGGGVIGLRIVPGVRAGQPSDRARRRAGVFKPEVIRPGEASR